MKLLGLFLLTLTASVFIAQDAFALRLARQEKRIERGIKKGNLTRGEVKILRHQGRAIKQKRQELAADGQLSIQDRLELRKMRRERSREIRELKKNDVTNESKSCAIARKKAQVMRFAPGGLEQYLQANGC